MSSLSGLSALSRERDKPSVPRPPFRWRTRIVVPFVILAATAALLLWSARSALWPRLDVRVAPVIAKPRGAESDPGMEGPAEAEPGPEQVLAQAPGWFEPEPFAIGVAALTEGTVREVLVLEGERVEADQVVVRLVDDDAKLALALAEAALAERDADIAESQAMVAAAEARALEVRDEVERKRELTDDGTIAAAQVARLELRLRGMEAEATAARAGVAVAQAARASQAVMVAQAQLAMDRTQIRSPVAGVVLERLIEPGSRVMMPRAGGGESAGSEVLRLYNPASLQVRVDVPLADAAKIGIGTRARITSETLPDVEFRGEVLRIVHRADIERNTVQFKVSVPDPHSALKPEMLARVRFVTHSTGVASGATHGHDSGGTGNVILLIDERCVQNRDGTNAVAWRIAVDRRGNTTAERRQIVWATARDTGFVQVIEGLAPTDRALIEPPASLTEGMAVRVVSDADTAEGGSR